MISEMESGHNPQELVDALHRELKNSGRIRLTPEGLAAGTRHDPHEALALLQQRARTGELLAERRLTCPACREVLSEEQATEEVCPHCGEAYADHQGIREAWSFIRDAPIGRDVRWILTLHGMNTPGAWQEQLNWLVSRSYGRMLPVVVHKYGIVRPGAILKFRQRQLREELAERIETLSFEGKAADLGGRPDVIAHSFGTWLLGNALREHKNLQVGRVILTGSILPPNFPWAELVARGQVEAVLNHFGTRDFWAAIAQFVIPGSGPSGRCGFAGHRVINVPAAGFTHSQFFEPKTMEIIFPEVWEKFLNNPAEKLGTVLQATRPDRPWQPVTWLLRANLPRWFVLALVGGLAILLTAALLLGLADIGHWAME